MTFRSIGLRYSEPHWTTSRCSSDGTGPGWLTPPQDDRAARVQRGRTELPQGMGCFALTLRLAVGSLLPQASPFTLLPPSLQKEPDVDRTSFISCSNPGLCTEMQQQHAWCSPQPPSRAQAVPLVLIPFCFPLGWGKQERGEFRGRTAVRAIPEAYPLSAQAATLSPTFPMMLLQDCGVGRFVLEQTAAAPRELPAAEGHPVRTGILSALITFCLSSCCCWRHCRTGQPVEHPGGKAPGDSALPAVISSLRVLSLDTPWSKPCAIQTNVRALTKGESTNQQQSFSQSRKGLTRSTGREKGRNVFGKKLLGC